MRLIVISMGLVSATVFADPPDFANQTETITAIGELSAECTNSGRDADIVNRCIETCASSRRMAQSQYAKTSPTIMSIRSAYEACAEARDVALAAGSTLDTSTWKVAGAGLGDDFNALFETFDKSKAMVEAKGYFAEDDIETSRRLWFYAEGEQEAPPQIVEQYSFMIRDGKTFVQGEADGQQRITFLLFRDRNEGDGDARRQMLIDRYGEPRTESGGTLEWGCESSSGPCLQAEPSQWSLEVRMRNTDAMTAWTSEYDRLVAEARGESTESRF